MTTISASGPRATRTKNESQTVGTAARLEREADSLYTLACDAGARNDYREAGLLLARHTDRLTRARALAPSHVTRTF